MNIQNRLENHLKQLVIPGTALEIRIKGRSSRHVTATGEVHYLEDFPYVNWGVGYKDSLTKMEGWVMIDYVFIK